MSSFAGWCPLRIFWNPDGEAMVDWIFLGQRRFEEPFFEDTMQQLLYHPFHCAFRRVTPLAELDGLPAGIAPTGFIFHMSRCGSTLLSRMLSAISTNIVLSECSPVDAVLRGGRAGDEERIGWLRFTVNALAQPLGGHEKNLFIKFDCWNIAQLPLVRRAFPNVPWLFIYRDPFEVLLSHLRMPGRWTFPEQLYLGLDPQLAHDEYCARALARICEIACDQLPIHQGRPMPYDEVISLAAAGCRGLFGLEYTGHDKDAILAIARENSKTPGQPFVQRVSGRDERATARARELSDTIMEPVYKKLGTLHAAWV
jgi:hypothetical protein